MIVDAADPFWSDVIQYTMPDNDVVEINTTTLTTNRYFARVGTVNLRSPDARRFSVPRARSPAWMLEAAAPVRRSSTR